MQIMAYPDSPCYNQGRPIEPKRLYRRTANRCAADDPHRIATPSKMVRPLVLSRMKKVNQISSRGIRRLSTRLFKTVTPETTPTQVRQTIPASARFGNNVVYREVMPGKISA
jgi:hypothetical protein